MEVGCVQIQKSVKEDASLPQRDKQQANVKKIIVPLCAVRKRLLKTDAFLLQNSAQCFNRQNFLT
ncbi:TPA: hypothetical protein DDY47_03265 [candidate division WWE3 bacterium]|uniref:Uncharacterized protein n=2 Tax=Katanobacteria TaxID=422282 RepID=A0A1F4W0M9_UNCKA|nr:MAG: hypothetical protein A2200_01475 [candidate division WWE3 bacterium RIFOXYA1_FULL_41_11]OGC62895.1 MAG: hypothetical protein A2399_01825 [candidate division WWE3 bacterium RIFOXYB1_FULL_42_27]OGC71660.1 MAG: hypothetical protein A2578_03435 [candidate division WWE3 bacterium RIFOXYD1_FULL_42_24]OGC75301.1 MAG: hypothetical protein A2425_03015 [candidate division WWE3 bacterium RIFOXYC1_FULL_42_17]HBI35921.1 hypothetical protein [candidate division WWE3 bacterium]